jgi:hypothetical protein
MKPNQTVPLLASFSSLGTAAPPLLIVAAIAGGLVWLFSGKAESGKQKQSEAPQPIAPTAKMSERSPGHIDTLKTLRRQVTRDDLAQALAYGARSMTRQEAVAALQALGFKKTAAYKALSENGRFADLIEHDADGLIEWRG